MHSIDARLRLRTIDSVTCLEDIGGTGDSGGQADCT
jgi:hypothetical protein